MTFSRRNFLGGVGAGAAGSALTAGLMVGGSRADAAGTQANSMTTESSYDMYGEHQAGIERPGPSSKQPSASYVSFDLTATSKSDAADLMQTITDRLRNLTKGGAAPNLGPGQPPSDSDVLGPDIPADGLTGTVGFGASMFDERYGLASRKPVKLTPMRVFPNDKLEDAWTHGDLMLQLCANHQDTVHHALRDILKHTRGGMQIRWRMEGYNSPSRPTGTGRNLLGFKDGTANPTGTTASSLIWTDDPAEPAWAKGGTYQVVRLIRMFTEFWDRVSITEQEGMFGRRRDSGAPLDGNNEFDTPDYAKDPKGNVIPTDSHIRLANPRTPATANQMLVRRSYNYDLGVDTNGNLQSGHIFVCYQQDVQRQFEAIQTRLIDEPLVDYVQPFGGGYFFVAPGVQDSNDWLGRGLFT
ncbi:iron uptake transporter deferrochelatase/peroxidase subunit [Rudaeicoccus suwonensis]|uniref:Deferrochelatase n=1 Tax=Rudaeicoccus suwonensis TaxID=657409 RepID=A0A561E3C5_9MICO|nr:iron uptake transporter deferrochelatase/peroxidase subunit [Rudaeicoccus suwonensis]TWE10115.1 deferrochelatase/peroxidase EfeB [Rudaeicoccus suwonensis]